ncbi:MAG: sarcosine oxidase, partial [Pseudomonas sp.]|nr:sarcosine oxidase [Pseudomonas sp.]
NYLLPRQDSHAWLLLTGAHVSEVMAKLCGVDLRPQAFAPGSVAQTSAARISVIVIHAPIAELPALHIFCDRASACYFWDALLDAMAEFGGQPVGIDSLLKQ